MECFSIFPFGISCGFWFSTFFLSSVDSDFRFCISCGFCFSTLCLSVYLVDSGIQPFSFRDILRIVVFGLFPLRIPGGFQKTMDGVLIWMMDGRMDGWIDGWMD